MGLLRRDVVMNRWSGVTAAKLEVVRDAAMLSKTLA